MQAIGAASDPIGMDYLDFDLEIRPGRGLKYPVAVLYSPAGDTPATTMRFPYDAPTLERRLDKLQIARLSSARRFRQHLSHEEQAVRDFGRDLFDALFTGEVRSRYDVSLQEAENQNKGLRLKLRIEPPELAVLPWEFMYDPVQAKYLCLSRNTPVIRYLPVPYPAKPLAITPPLRILGMVASPGDLPRLDIERERQRVEQALEAAQAQGLIKLTWLEGQSWNALQRAMRRGPWHIFHFIGHGGFDRSADEGFIALVDEASQTYRLSATQLGQLLDGHHDLRLVLLNACEGARGSDCDVFSSTAAVLVRQSIPAVLAMQCEISDQAAIKLAGAFYEALSDGMPVDAAVTEARVALSLTIANTVEWGTPALYMHCSDGVLFRIQKQEAKSSADETLDKWYQQGAQAFQNGQWAAAIKCFERVVAQNPLYNNVENLLAEAKAKIQQEQELEALYQQGVQALLNGRWSTARKYFEGIMAQNPLYKNAAELLAEAKLKQKVQEARWGQRWMRSNQTVYTIIGAIVTMLAFLVAIGNWLWPDARLLLFPHEATATPTSVMPATDLTNAHVTFVLKFSNGDERQVSAGNTLTLSTGDIILIQTSVTEDGAQFPHDLTYQYSTARGNISNTKVGPWSSYNAPEQPGPDFITVLIKDQETGEEVLRSIRVTVEPSSP